jgi:CubicO group peptidase (beta-lactamase class C family)
MAPPESLGMSSRALGRIRDSMVAHVDEGRLPGALTVVARRGRIAHLESVGWMDVEGLVPVRSDTIFRVYSMTKPVTAAAMMILHEAGRFRISDPVSDYLTEMRELAVFSGGTAERPQTVSARPMTMKHLLTHTSGLIYEDIAPSGLAMMYAKADLFGVRSLEAFIERLALLPLAAQPGSAWNYGVSSDVLGRIVEVLSGEPFDRFLEDRVFAPLGMVDTAFRVPEEKLERFAKCYGLGPDGKIKAVEAAHGTPFLDPRIVPFGGHGLVSTGADYLRFAQMLANGGKLGKVRLLQRKTVDLMMTNHLGPEFGYRPLSALESSLQCDSRGIGFGFGGAVTTPAAEESFHASTGTFSWGGNASTYFWVDRTMELIGILMTQLIPSDALPLRAEMRASTRAACAP